MLYFVLKQHRENGHTYDNNVRIGGFRTFKGAMNAANKYAPALIVNESRKILAQSVMGEYPFYTGIQ